MKKLLVVTMLALVTVNHGHAQEQGTIPTLKSLKNEAKAIIKDFELTDLGVDAGAPEYRTLRDLMHAKIRKEIEDLDTHLNDINQRLSLDYSLIVSLKKQKKDSAVKGTIEVATNRLKDKVNQLTAEYQKRLKSIIFLDSYQSPIIKKCLTVLCVEKLNLDFQNWHKKAKALNQSLDLEVTSMPALSDFSKLAKNEKKYLWDLKTDTSKYLPVAITTEEYEDHLRVEREKVEEKIRKQRELENLAAKEKAAQEALQARLERRTDQPYGCEKVEMLKKDSIFKCHNPYKIIEDRKSYIPELSEEIYKDICSAHNLKKQNLGFGWNMNNKRTEVKNDYYYNSVTCLSNDYDETSRLNFNKSFLADGSLLVSDLKIEIEGDYARLYWFHYEEFNLMPTNICQELGYSKATGIKRAVDPNKSYFYGAEITELTSPYAESIVSSFTCVK